MYKYRTIPTSIITDEDPISEDVSNILIKLESFGFKSVSLVMMYPGKVPDFNITESSKAYTFLAEFYLKNNITKTKGFIEPVTDIRDNSSVVPEMYELNEMILESAFKSLSNLPDTFKENSDLTVCYWHKIPLIGILIINQPQLTIESKEIIDANKIIVKSSLDDPRVL